MKNVKTSKRPVNIKNMYKITKYRLKKAIQNI